LLDPVYSYIYISDRKSKKHKMSVPFPTNPHEFVTPPSSPREPPVPPGAPPRYLKTFNNENFFMKLMARFNEFLEHKEKPVLETPNVLRSDKQRPLSIQSVDRNGVKVVHDMELLAQYNELQKIDIQKLYSEFIAELPENFNTHLREYAEREIADIWANGTSDTFQHDPEYFLFGIIVRGFKDSIESLKKTLRNHLLQEQQDEDDDDEGF
jgi:hypothetical protein